MHDAFWSLAGRQKWYEPEPSNMMHLGAFFIDLGKIKYGPMWLGGEGLPDPITALALKEEIAQAAASGHINTVVLNPRTREWNPIARAGWRNAKALSAPFSRCRIDANDVVSDAAEGRHHGDIYVERKGAMAYLDRARSEPRRVCRRLFGLSHAAIADVLIMA